MAGTGYLIRDINPGVSRETQSNIADHICSRLPSYLDSKILFLKILNILVTEHREINPELTERSSYC